MSSATEISQDRRSVIRVLVADADDDARLVYRRSLTLAGCDVVDAADGRDAMVKALSHRPTLVITETRLPIFDGYALCEVLRRDSMTHSVPILVVTAETRTTELDRARGAGADIVLTKPVPLDALLTAIQQLLRPSERTNEPTNETSELGVARRTSLAEHRRKPLVKVHRRFATTTPPIKPPDLVCPSCNAPLAYAHSHIGGVSIQHPEQWDDYVCPGSCGTFVYRHRTGKLRHAG